MLFAEMKDIHMKNRSNWRLTAMGYEALLRGGQQERTKNDENVNGR
jgi:hypothetical protein